MLSKKSLCKKDSTFYKCDVTVVGTQPASQVANYLASKVVHMNLCQRLKGEVVSLMSVYVEGVNHHIIQRCCVKFKAV